MSVHDDGRVGPVPPSEHDGDDAGPSILVIGLGYIGSVTAACFAELGFRVHGVDPDEHKVDAVRSGRSPVREPQVDELMARHVATGRLTADLDLARALPEADIAFVCVGTPTGSDGAVDLTFLDRVVDAIASHVARRATDLHVVVRSTIPPGTLEARVAGALHQASNEHTAHVGVAMCPEFLREGSACADFLEPPFTVIGTNDDRTADVLAALFVRLGAPIHVVEPTTAEGLKYASNAFHALKVGFANEVARLGFAAGFDGPAVMDLLIQDTDLNISAAYLRPGFAFGGSCLPKDLRALVGLADASGVDLPIVQGVLPSNAGHLQLAVDLVLGTDAPVIGLIGLTFKNGTDDLRESPAVELAEALLAAGRDVIAFDPDIQPRLLIGANLRYVDEHLPHVASLLQDTVEAVASKADVLVVTSVHDGLREELLRLDVPVIDLTGTLRWLADEGPRLRGLAW